MERSETGAASPVGRDRWEVRVKEGPPRGGLYELEQDTFFHVIDRWDGRRVKTFTGHYDASFTGEGRWGEGFSSGVRQVVIDEEGKRAFGMHFNRMVECFRLTEEPVTEDPSLPWRLAGLPLPEVPMTVDGLLIDDGIDFDALLARVAEGWLPSEVLPCYRSLPVAWICDLYLRLNGLPAATGLALAVERSVAAASDSQRGAALWFYRRIPHAQGRQSVLEIVRLRGIDEAVRVSRVRYGGDGWLLVAPIDVLVAILDGSELDSRGVAALELCGKALLTPTSYCEESHLEAMARYDPGWLARNASAVVRACPSRLNPLLSRLYLAGRNDLVVAVGVALGRDPSIDRQALEAWLARAPAGLEVAEIRNALPPVSTGTRQNRN